MPRHRSHSIDCKCQVVAEYHAGETLHALGRRRIQFPSFSQSRPVFGCFCGT
jgi:hypothetical protein